MNIQQYQQEVKRTVAPLFGYDANYEHFMAGIITELGEIIDPYKKLLAYGKKVDIVNIKEEIGDLMWYISNLCNMGELLIPNMENIVIEFKWDNIETLFNLRLALKSFLVTENAFALVYDIKVACLNFGVDFDECLQLNIDKLRKRYPEKFIPEQAINRDLDAERSILEGI